MKLQLNWKGYEYVRKFKKQFHWNYTKKLLITQKTNFMSNLPKHSKYANICTVKPYSCIKCYEMTYASLCILLYVRKKINVQLLSPACEQLLGLSGTFLSKINFKIHYVNTRT